MKNTGITLLKFKFHVQSSLQPWDLSTVFAIQQGSLYYVLPPLGGGGGNDRPDLGGK